MASNVPQNLNWSFESESCSDVTTSTAKEHLTSTPETESLNMVTKNPQSFFCRNYERLDSEPSCRPKTTNNIFRRYRPIASMIEEMETNKERIQDELSYWDVVLAMRQVMMELNKTNKQHLSKKDIAEFNRAAKEENKLVSNINH